MVLPNRILSYHIKGTHGQNKCILKKKKLIWTQIVILAQNVIQLKVCKDEPRLSGIQ